MTAPRTAPELELPLRLEHGGHSLYLQLADQLRSAIRKGLLPSGTRLPPPVRSRGRWASRVISWSRPTCGNEAPFLVYVTPSHHYPLVARLSLARRLALLEWAGAHDRLIIEDDYDSEFRYDALRPISDEWHGKLPRVLLIGLRA
jgi:DNA-binding transcriptional MocR family regulator